MKFSIEYDADGTDPVISCKIDPPDLWSVDVTLAHFILPVLQAYRYLNRQGVPTAFIVPEDDDDLTQSNAAWNAALDKMIFAFDALRYLPDPNEPEAPDDLLEEFQDEEGRTLWRPSPNSKKRKEWHKASEAYHKAKDAKTKEGLKLFAKYFSNLWD